MTNRPLNDLHCADYPSAPSPPERAQGTVQRLDPLGREIVVLLPTGSKVFYVPPDCPTYLRGERIKLRIAQPKDEVRVTFAQEDGVLLVKLLEIWPPSSLA